MIAGLLLGLVIGLLVGLLGAGGSILAVPALIYGVGVSPAIAVTMSLVIVGLSSASALAARLRDGVIQWRVALLMGSAGLVTAFAGAAVNRMLSEHLLLLGFAAVMLAAGLRMLHDFTKPMADNNTGDSISHLTPKALLTGAVVGFLTGLFGVGGGFLMVPALVLVFRLSMQAAVATSLAVIVMNSAAGFVAHGGIGELDLGLTSAFTGAAVVGSLIGARLAPRLPSQVLKRWFAYLVMAIAAFVTVQAVLGLAT